MGPEQHGHMETAVDMYLKLLDETVSELKGESVSTRDIETTVV